MESPIIIWSNESASVNQESQKELHSPKEIIDDQREKESGIAGLVGGSLLVSSNKNSREDALQNELSVYYKKKEEINKNEQSPISRGKSLLNLQNELANNTSELASIKQILEKERQELIDMIEQIKNDQARSDDLQIQFSQLQNERSLIEKEKLRILQEREALEIEKNDIVSKSHQLHILAQSLEASVLKEQKKKLFSSINFLVKKTSAAIEEEKNNRNNYMKQQLYNGVNELSTSIIPANELNNTPDIQVEENIVMNS